MTLATPWLNLGRIGCTAVSYDGVNLSDTFEVRDIQTSLMPSIEASTLTIYDRPGVYFASRQIRTRTITLVLALDVQSRCPVDILEVWRAHADKLAKDSPRKLELGNNGYIWAMLTGETPIENEAYKGVVTAEFTCFDPFFYGDEHEERLEAGENTLYIHGRGPVFPVFEVTGASGALTLENLDTGDELKVLDLAAEKTLRIYMDDHYCTLDGVYCPCDPTVSDFWAIPAGCARLRLSQGEGTMRYIERSL